MIKHVILPLFPIFGLELVKVYLIDSKCVGCSGYENKNK